MAMEATTAGMGYCMGAKPVKRTAAEDYRRPGRPGKTAGEDGDQGRGGQAREGQQRGGTRAAGETGFTRGRRRSLRARERKTMTWLDKDPTARDGLI